MTLHLRQGMVMGACLFATAVGNAESAEGKHAKGAAPSKPTAPPPQAPLAPDACFKGLPPAASVDAAFRDAAAVVGSPQDYAAKQKTEAAFAVLGNYLEIRCKAKRGANGFVDLSSLTPAAQLKWREYAGHGYWMGLTGDSWQLFMAPLFRRDVLSRFVAPDSILAYETERNRIPNVAGPSNVDPTPPSVGASPSASPPIVGRTLFGKITIGAPLSLPPCGATLSMSLSQGPDFGAFFGSSNTAARPTCVGDEDDLSSHVSARMLSAPEMMPGVAFHLISLAASACPDWKSASGNCTVGVAVKGGLVAAVAFETGDAGFEAKVLKALTTKFSGDRPQEKTEENCTERSIAYGVENIKGSKYFWPSQELLIAYWTTGGTVCERGKAGVETKKFEAAIHEANAQHDASQPQL